MTDVHAYRDAIADDCVIGTCSMNNCLYPDCSVSGLIACGKIVDDVVQTTPSMFKVCEAHRIDDEAAP